MSLQFVLGASGSGKSTHLFHEIIEKSVANPREQFMFIVPEQFTLQIQKTLVDLHPKHSVMNIEVLSFERLAHRVFDELGTDTKKVLEETGKNLVIRRVAELESDQLTVLKGNMKKQGYVSELKSLLSELTQYRVTPELLEEMIEHPKMSEAFRYKAKDVLTIYQAFMGYTEGKYITTEELLNLLNEVIPASGFVRNATIVFDGYTGFTPIQRELLYTMLPMAKKVYLAVTIPKEETVHGEIMDTDLFAMSKRMIQQLEEIAKTTKVELEEPIRLPVESTCRFKKDSVLVHLEQNLFRPSYQKAEASSDLQIHQLLNPREELMFVAASIRKKVRTEKVRYGDFAVLCANMEDYKNYIEDVFSIYDIPVFIDAKNDISFQPCVEALRSLLNMELQNYSYESVFQFLKCGMHDFTLYELDAFENYVYGTGLRGKKAYLKEFTYRPKAMAEEDFALANEVRANFVAMLQPLFQLMEEKEHTGESITRALYDFLLQNEYQKKLMDIAKEYEDNQDRVHAKEYEQIYGIIIQLFDKIVSLLASEKMSLQEYAEIFDAGIAASKVGVIPASSDHVVFGDIERTRVGEIQYLYLVGANDGAIPKASASGGIFSELDRERLKDAAFHLAPTTREHSFEQRFYLYQILTKPSRGVMISYSRVASDGASLRASYLIGSITKLFTNLKVVEHLLFPKEAYLETQKSTEIYFMQLLREYLAGEDVEEEELQELLQFFKLRDVKELDRMMQAASFVHRNDRISESVMTALRGETISGSVSLLEQYASCAYRYFLDYCLELKERERPDLEILDMGNLYHNTLERYSQTLTNSDLDWVTITKEEQNAILQRAIQETVEEFTAAKNVSSEREKYIIRRMEKTLDRTVSVLTEQVRQGQFVPRGFEVSFHEFQDLDSLRIALNSGHKMQLKGKIDRIDTYENDGRVYIKIIDYKSGKPDIDYTKLYEGLQMQLITYMDAAIENYSKQNPDKKVLPGALFYYHIDYPEIECKSGAIPMENENWEEKMLLALRCTGLMNEVGEVIDALDQNFGPGDTSMVVPLKRNKDSSYDRYSVPRLISEGDYSVMSQFVRAKMTKMGNRMVGGDIAIDPYYNDANTNSCNYCAYKGLCGFDTKIPGFTYRKLQEQTRDTIIDAMKESLSKQGVEDE